MTRHLLPFFASAALAAISACVPIPRSAQGGSTNSGGKGRTSHLSAEDRQQLREAGGDELVADYEFAETTAGPDGHTLRACVNYYVNAATKPRDGNPSSPARQYKECVRTCSEVANGQYGNVAGKYLAKCREKNDANAAEKGLEDAKSNMEGFRQSSSPMGWYLNTIPTRLSLDRAKERLGPDNEELRQLFAEYDRLFAAHRKEIKAAQDFRERPDIVDLLARGKVLDQELPDLRKRYDMGHSKSTADLIRLKQEERDAIENEYQSKGIKAHVLKAK